jgi:hypothetical protein
MKSTLAIILTWVAAGILANAAQSDPETVYVIFSIKQGREKEFEDVNKQAWAAYQRLGLVFSEPQVSVKGKDQKNRPFVVDIMTWKSHSIPDNIPSEIEPIWAKMRALCEKRDGRDGIDFTEVHPLSGEPR